MSNSSFTLTPLSREHVAEPAGQILDRTERAFGFVPRMYSAMAHLPALLEAYVHGYQQFRTGSGFSPVEQEVVLLAISRENACEYCVAAHSFIADQMSGVPVEVTDAIRDGHPVPDERLAALAAFCTVMTRTRGLPSEADLAAFRAAGYDDRHVLAVILGLGVKTFSNYVNHQFQTETDSAFGTRRWSAEPVARPAVESVTGPA